MEADRGTDDTRERPTCGRLKGSYNSQPETRTRVCARHNSASTSKSHPVRGGWNAGVTTATTLRGLS